MARSVLLVSGGAESVTVAIAEWAIDSGREVVVYSLVPSSILAGLPGIGRVAYAPSTTRDGVLAALDAFIRRMSELEGSPILAFPTEDDSLGLLMELSATLGDHVLSVSRCRALTKGGLDKAELFSHLKAAGLEAIIAETMSVMDESDVSAARAVFGEDVIIKPASKPWSRSLSGGAKIHSGSELDSQGAVGDRLRDFSTGRPWVAQRRLSPLGGGERSACVVRDANGSVRYAEVVEWLKYPERGGSACIVETQPGGNELWEATIAILSAVDAIGIVELSYLADSSGKPRLLELNPRPWLQIDLLQSAGFDVLGDAAKVLGGGAVRPEVVAVRPATWVSLERLLLKLLSGDGGSRWRTLRAALGAFARRPRVSTWGSRLPGVRKAWLVRNLQRMVR